MWDEKTGINDRPGNRGKRIFIEAKAVWGS
jgi:hypothetical protein